MKTALRILLVVAFVAFATSAYAGETGSISGTVKDGTGAPVPGATVKISGPQLPAGRTAVTSSGGAFNFVKLIPGAYKVEAELQGLGRAAKQVTVYVDADVQVALSLVQAAVAQVTVTAEAVTVDQKSSEVAVNISEKEIRALPLPRSYSGLTQLVPGATTDPNYAGFNAGGTVQDNTYLLDGVNITNPGFGYLSIETNELDIADFNVKRGGISAETRAVGAVVNAVTKTGTNTLAGALRIEAVPDVFSADSKNDTLGYKTDRYVLGANVGFPIVKDILFGYASARFRMDDTTDRVNSWGNLPDEEYDEQEYHAKLTYFPTQSHFISVAGRVIPQKTKNGLGSLDKPSAAYGEDNTQWTVSAAWNWFVGANTNVEAKYIHLTEEGQILAETNVGLTPPWDPANICNNGTYTPAGATGNCGIYEFRSNNQNYKRDEFRINANQFFDLAGSQHQLKVGFGYEESEEDLTRLANGWGAIARSTSTINGKRASYRARWYPDQSTQLSPAATWTFFLQDTVTFGSRLTVTAGFMVNRDAYGQTIAGVQNNFLTFRYGQEFQPRLGIVWNPELLKGDKIYGNYGKYMDLNQKSTARSLAPARIYQMETYFDAAGTLLRTAPRASATGKTIVPGIKPTYMEEIVGGYSAPIGGKWSVDLWGQYRSTQHFIEDVPSTYPDFGPYKAANLDEFGASRIYRALTLEVQRRFADHWALNASYTYSKFKGNFDLDYSGGGVFNTSSFLQDGPGWYVYDPNRFGLLSTDRPHVLKVFGSYEIAGLTLGGYLRVQSGRAWEARGDDSQSSSYNRYLEPAGSRRMPTWTNFDFLVAYTIPVKPVNIRLEARILNLFNTQSTLSVDRVKYYDSFEYADNDPPLYAAPQGTSEPNANFGAPTSYAPPRRFLLSATVDF